MQSPPRTKKTTKLSPAEKKDRKRLRERAHQAKKREYPNVCDKENAQQRALMAKKREDPDPLRSASSSSRGAQQRRLVSSMEASDAAQRAELEAKPPAKKPRTEKSSAAKSDDPYNFDDDDDEFEAEMVAACVQVENRKKGEEFNRTGLKSVLRLVGETMELKHDPLATCMVSLSSGSYLSEYFDSDVQRWLIGLLSTRGFQSRSPLTLHVLRRTCKSAKIVAEELAKQKLASLDLTLTPLVDGRYRAGDDNYHFYDSDNCSKVDENLHFVGYKKREVMKLSSATDGYFHPRNVAAATFSWDSGSLKRYADDYDNDWGDTYGTTGDSTEEDAYSGQKMRLSWHPRSTDLIKPSPRINMYERVLPSLGVSLAEFHFGDCPNQGVATKTSSSGYIVAEYEVLESNTQEITEEEEQDDDGNVNDYEEEEEEEEEKQVVTRDYIRYSGTIKINRVKVDFGAIVREYAFEVQHKTKGEHLEILKERPLTEAEKAYYRMLSKATGIRWAGDP
ncbi:hypothetical protein THAOC_01351 [Thalassiosira oceanica]|uniref:Uncharacterized protein n=1 Tax=Thalassiosira oceanica TaxID=159749 RepID=K0THF2_THAOC|nr:hypothetical protein THAOC_01351 [Thalassiosira oceanica]|eukprot:EJK76860.1 hypothetical protein THAOC_01351 [Thalassiosira oceanica]